MHDSNSVTRFKYPIPLCDGLETPLLSHRDTLLCCRTHQAAFQLDGRVDFAVGAHHNNVILRSISGAWAGILTLHHNPRKHLISWDLSKDEAAQIPSACQLVAISTGYAIEGEGACDMDEWDYTERPRASKGSKYEFYNMLWVEWKDGIAYRKGCGRVMKKAWEEEEREWIDLVLG
ncbi:hypothetical protein DL98DRAFT_528668 [Cadophora sp. DSE1049]|nr:hypothetical protein DL98DRAFT_528668 [Cadophora sp. DSE1049]